MNLLNLLDDLQKIDSQIAKNQELCQSIEARLINDSTLTDVQNSLNLAIQQSNALRARLRALEMQIQSLDDKINVVEARLYGGKISNPKELGGLEQDGQMHKRHKHEIEDQMLDLMTQIEVADTMVYTQRAALERISAESAHSHTLDRAQLAELKNAAEKLAVAREQQRAQISPTDLQTYDDLSNAKKGRAVSKIKNTSCSTCGFGVPSGLVSRARMGELTFCTNCGRILVP